MNPTIHMVSAVAVVVAFAAPARAQNAVTAEQPEAGLLAAPTRALEIVVGTGYTQGFGELQKGVNLRDVATPGISVDLGVGYRLDPHWQIGVVGAYQQFDAQRASGARGMTAALDVAYHVLPYSRFDPWVQFATGYRALWETNATTPDVLTQGLELGKLTAGLDLRASRDVAISPVLGADLTLPLWQGASGSSTTAISDPRPSVYLFAGVQARFDITSTHVTETTTPPVEETTTVTQAVVQPPPPPRVNVSEQVLDACKDLLDNPATAPKFDFDHSAILLADVEVLAKVAACFTTGPLKNDDLVLVGRADPRGTVAYNDALGMRRAKAIATYFEQAGVDTKRIETTSRGERDAVGTDEASWATDRRTDMLRIEMAHPHE